MPKLALHIIAKDEVEKVKNIISLYEKYFDEIAIAVDQCVDEFKALANDKVKIYEYQWINDFSHKRNFLAERTESEYYFRMDTDDLLENPEIIPSLFDQIVSQEFDVVMVLYDYAKDENGNCIAAHWRETIIKKRPDVYWKKEIHENLHMDDQDSCRMARDEKLRIIHNIDEEHIKESTERNFSYLLNEFKKNGENTDPRTIAYLGRMLMSKGQYDTAIIFLENLVKRSGWDDDKYFAWVQMSICYQSLKNYDTAIACCNEALAINTQFPDAYLQMGSIYLEKQDYVKAVDWFMSGIARPKPNTVIVVDPSIYTFKGKANAALALLGKGDIQKACALYAEAKSIAPENELIKKYEPIFIEAYNNDEFYKSLIKVSKYIAAREPNKVELLAESIPNDALKVDRISQFKSMISRPKKWSNKSVVFYCGNAWEDWADLSVMNGIGGSEEAVIYLSRELVKLGWEVTVYNQCGEFAGVYNGVEYKPYIEFNKRDHFNYFISWRNNIFKHVDIIAKKTILWLHDVPYDLEGSRGNRFNKVVVLSEFHKSLLPSNVDRTQIYVSSNGINLEDFKDSIVERNPYRMIYTSSYDRGIEHLLTMWPEIKLQVPEAELHLFYGWNTYDKMMESGRRPKDFKNLMVKLMNQEGIYEHGRIGHRKLVKELQKSSIWVYPSHFEEISCISAMKAQAAGCIPVCTDYAALTETVKTGIKTEGSCKDEQVREEFKKSLIEILKDSGKQEEIRKEVIKHKESFGWDKVASQWTDSLLVLKPREYSGLDEYERMYSLANRREKTFRGVLPRYKWALDFVKKNNLKSGIDVGCFDASLATYLVLENNKDFKCDALDISRHGLDQAFKINDEMSLGINFIIGKSFENADIVNKYDAIFMFETFEHVIDRDIVLQKCNEILNDDGYVLITIPSKNGVFGYDNEVSFNDSHMINWGSDELKECVSRHFSIVDVEEKDDLVYLIGRKIKVEATV